MNTTHITATIRAILEREDKPESWLASLVGLSAPTINRTTQHRVSPETLRALCTRTPSGYGLEILIAHLRDEIDRSGRLQTEIKIDAASGTTDDFTLLAIEAQTNPDLADVLHSMASMIRTAQAKLRATRYPEPTERAALAAEPEPAPYGSKKPLIGRVTTDLDRLVISINDDFTRICGYTLPELQGRNLKDILQRTPGTEPEVVARIHAALAARQPITETLTNYHKAGHPYRCLLQIHPTPTGFEGEARLA